MTRRTRVFLFVSGGILAVGLGTGLVAAYMGGFKNLGLLASSGPDEELAYVPEGVRVVAYANLHDVVASELYQKLTAQRPPEESGAAKFEAETGVNLTRDVDYVVVSSAGPAAGKTGDSPLILARGRFDTARIEGLVRSRGAEEEDYRGTRLFSAVAPNGGPSFAGNRSFALAFLEPGLLGLGSTESVRRAIDVHAGVAPNVTTNGDMMRLVRAADDGNAWAVAQFDALTPEQLPKEVASRLPAINWVSVTGHVDGGLRASLRAETRDDAGAKNLRDVIQGGLALVRMQSAQRADVAAIVNSIELGGEGRNVSLSLSVPSEALDLLASLHAPGGSRGAQPAPPAPPAPPAAPAPPVTAP